ncbi:efflux RND transporter permease subunit [Marivibrio halodurans]|uniref:Efflux RND transporter permease subunit n=1 Tax=Marivibrio halodurans TaxID=2039722 RepID=A0A8J7S2N7_9PROT|nr:efflux RND transporter permease subunit [Marivibrio halodurans]MBP5857534.1 efflux RND transporter permease subunit [Marivibrio halodurans]
MAGEGESAGTEPSGDGGGQDSPGRSLRAGVSGRLLSGVPALSIRRPVLVVVANLLIVIAGLAAILGVEVRELPDIDRPTISIRAVWDGAAPETMDSEVTSVIEGAAARVPGVRSIESSSEENNARIRVEFNPGVDLTEAANDLREAVAGVERELPDGVEDLTVVKADADAEPIIRLAVVSDSLSEAELTELADEEIATDLSSVAGVAEVRLFGDREQVLRVVVDPLKLAGYGLTVDQLAAVLDRANFDVPAGSYKSDDQMLIVRADASIWQTEKIENLIVRDHLRLGDVAEIFYGPADATSYVQVDGQRVIGLGVVRQAQSNTVAISDGIARAVDRMNARLKQARIVMVSDDAVFIRSAIKEVLVTLGLAVVIVIAVIYLFMGSIRPTLIPAATIPVALIGTVAAIWLVGFSINILTLLALVLATGLIVDDSIVVLENIQRRRAQGLAPFAAAAAGTRQVFFAVLATTATLISVFVPISFLPGTAGRLFTEFGFVLAIAVVLSSVVALTLCPMLAARLPDTRDRPDDRRTAQGSGLGAIGKPVADLFARMIDWALKAPLIVVAIALAAAVASAVLIRDIDQELVPVEDRGVVLVWMSGPDGVGLEYMARQVEKVEEALRPLRADGTVQTIFSIVGRYDMHRAYTVAPLQPWEMRTRSQQEIGDSLRRQLAGIPGANVRIFSPNSLGLGGGTGGLEIALLGNDYQELADAGDAMMAAMQERFPGKMDDIRLSYQATQPELSLEIDRRRASDLGIPIEGISTTLRAMVDGYEVTDLTVRDESVPVMLQSMAGTIDGPEDLRNLFVATEDGRMIPLVSLVSVSESGVATELDRNAQKRAVEIDAALLPGYELSDAIPDIEALGDEVLPQGITLRLLGEAETLEQTSIDVAVTFGVAILVVLLVLAAQFESFNSALVIILTVPFGVSAAIFALFLTGTSLNIYSQIGLIMLVGLMAKNGILVVEFADQLRDQGYSVRAAVRNAAIVRLRPVMMTMLSTVIGGLPLILGAGAGAEARGAIGWVVFGGLGLATLYTLFLAPVIYLGLARFVKPRAHGGERLAREIEEAGDAVERDSDVSQDSSSSDGRAPSGAA